MPFAVLGNPLPNFLRDAHGRLKNLYGDRDVDRGISPVCVLHAMTDSRLIAIADRACGVERLVPMAMHYWLKNDTIAYVEHKDHRALIAASNLYDKLPSFWEICDDELCINGFGVRRIGTYIFKVTKTEEVTDVHG